MSDPLTMKPYRVEWRLGLTTNWLLIGEVDTHDEANEVSNQTRQKYGGQTRVVTQHVIKAQGLGW